MKGRGQHLDRRVRHRSRIRWRAASTALAALFLAGPLALVTCTSGPQLALPSPEAGPPAGPAAGTPPGTPPKTTGGPGGPGAAVRPTWAVPSHPAPGQLGAPVRICGASFCIGDTPWFMYGASEYQSNPSTGIDHPDGTIALARQAHLNTIRVINFYDNHGDPRREPFSESQWRKLDAMIASAHAAEMHVVLDLSDYRNVLWNNCINPYTQDWNDFLKFVAGRRNTITGVNYHVDPTIALVSLAGEPLPVGAHSFAGASGGTCSLSYSGGELVDFYTRTLGQWAALSAIPVNTGGLGYLVFDSGIDWQAIFSLPTNAVCAIKTYGRMVNFVAAVSSFCASRGKPWIDEEFGWQQSMGDAARAREFANTNRLVRDHQGSGELFWNLGYQVKPTTYDIGTMTPLAFAAVVAAGQG
jgi:hypothetical protein